MESTESMQIGPLDVLKVIERKPVSTQALQTGGMTDHG